MSKAYDEAIARFISVSLGAFDKTVDFLSTEIPVFLHEVLSWYFTYNLILFLVSIAVLVVGGFAGRAVLRKANEIDAKTSWYDDDDTPSLLRGLVFPLVLLFSALGFALSVNLQWLKIWIAPKLWLIEYAASLAK